MILTRSVILAEIAAGRLELDPYDPTQVGPASVDLHLGDEIRVLSDSTLTTHVTDEPDYEAGTELRPLDTPYVMRPGETIHGITRERIRLPDDIAGWLEGRSRFARVGLMIHVTSGFVAPGVNGRQLVERLLEHNPRYEDRLYLFTGALDSPDISWIRGHTRVPILHKPFSLDAIMRVIVAAEQPAT